MPVPAARHSCHGRPDRGDRSVFLRPHFPAAPGSASRQLVPHRRTAILCLDNTGKVRSALRATYLLAARMDQPHPIRKRTVVGVVTADRIAADQDNGNRNTIFRVRSAASRSSTSTAPPASRMCCRSSTRNGPIRPRSRLSRRIAAGVAFHDVIDRSGIGWRHRKAMSSGCWRSAAN